MERGSSARVADDHIAFVAGCPDVERGGAAVGVDHLAPAAVDDDQVAFVVGCACVDRGVATLEPDHVTSCRIVDGHVALVAERANAQRRAGAVGEDDGLAGGVVDDEIAGLAAASDEHGGVGGSSMIASPALESTRTMPGTAAAPTVSCATEADEVEDLVRRSCELATDDEVAGLVDRAISLSLASRSRRSCSSMLTSCWKFGIGPP